MYSETNFLKQSLKAQSKLVAWLFMTQNWVMGSINYFSLYVSFVLAMHVSSKKSTNTLALKLFLVETLKQRR